VAGQGTQTVIDAFDKVLGQSTLAGLLFNEPEIGANVLSSTANAGAASSTTGGTTTQPAAANTST
jgi:hypothetical protein